MTIEEQYEKKIRPQVKAHLFIEGVDYPFKDAWVDKKEKEVMMEEQEAHEYVQSVSNSLLDAVLFAEEAHRGQMYGDKPYIVHCIEVSKRVITPFAKTVALLHDTIEDTFVTQEEIADVFGGSIAWYVKELTREPDEEYLAYINRCSRTVIGARVKEADILVNLENMTEDKASLIPRYKSALELIRSKRGK